MDTQKFPGLTDAERTVLDQKCRLYDEIVQSNQKLDERADRVVQAGSIIIGLGTIASIPVNLALWSGVHLNWLALLQLGAMGLSFLAFIILIPMSMYFFRPIGRQVPGDSDWDKTFDQYVNSETYFAQTLSDLMAGIQSAKQVNDYKAKRVLWLTVLLLVQTTALALAWTLSPFTQ